MIEVPGRHCTCRGSHCACRAGGKTARSSGPVVARPKTGRASRGWGLSQPATSLASTDTSKRYQARVHHSAFNLLNVERQPHPRRCGYPMCAAGRLVGLLAGVAGLPWRRVTTSSSPPPPSCPLFHASPACMHVCWYPAWWLFSDNELCRRTRTTTT